MEIHPAAADQELEDESAEAPAALQPGVALCLSGGGYRAMLFHLGALWRLNDAGYLPRLARVSSVSGGSITAGVLALAWPKLGFDDHGVAARFGAEVAEPLHRLAGRTIDFPAIITGLLLPRVTVADRVAAAYRRHLFGGATLQDLSDPPAPRFVLDATNISSGALWRFAKPYMRDYRVGEVRAPKVPLATAVAASSAFPPFLSPVRLKLSDSDFTSGSGDDLQRAPFTTRPFLTDGGVYDNLGLEPVWKRYDTILISDGGGHLTAQPKPKALWPLHAYRVLGVIDNQVRSLRKRGAIADFEAGRRKGTYWGIRTDIADYALPTSLPCPHDATLRLAAVPTRLGKMPEVTQQRLVNWGFAVCDAALRRHVDQQLPPPAAFPYASAGIS
jgi:NTE family protein